MKRLCDFSSRFRILKGGKISLVVSALLASTTISFASPTGGVVTSGNAQISQNGLVTNITQSSNKATINWQNFSIASNETVNFNQPNVSSVTLNRVVGNEMSIIDGALNANGQVWILNSNGILFNKNAKINTAGLLATTKNLSDEDFNAGNYNFSGDSTASVINKGTIESVDSSYVVFAANEVKNEGTIKAVRGTVHLTGADEVSLNLNGNSLLDLTVNKGVLDALVENSGTVYADGGSVYLTTNAVDELLKGVVNNTGVIEANSLDDLTSHVELFAHGGEAKIGGSITAHEGFVETSGKEFTFNDAKIEAGEWLIDPVNVTIDDSLATAIETQLSSGDAIITTDGGGSNPSTTSGESGSDGNIYVNSEIEWSTANRLNLMAYNNIYINKSITATNDNGKLALYYGQGAVNANNTSDYYINAPINLKAGDNFITKLGSDGAITTWTVITTKEALQAINTNSTSLAKDYVLGSDLDLSGIANWTPIGTVTGTFGGNFDGLGHTVDHLTINDTTTLGYAGFFGYAFNATIQNIGLTNVSISAIKENANVGGLVGILGRSTISNSYASGTVTGGDSSNVGGLVGFLDRSTISNSYASGTVTGGSGAEVGGLVGTDNSSTISYSWYDNEANTGTMNDDGLGATKTQIVTALSSLDAWTAGGDSVEGYSTATPLTLPQLVTFYTSDGEILFAGGYGTMENPYTITNWNQLQNINYNSEVLSGGYYYNLSNDLLNTTDGYTTQVKDGDILANNGTGWNPIGGVDESTYFIGFFDGRGHTIDSLAINAQRNNVALFGYIGNNGTVANLGVTNVDIHNDGINTGGLSAVNQGTISNSYVTGNISSEQEIVGGIASNVYKGSVNNSYSLANTSGSGSRVGTLIGNIYQGSVTNSYGSYNNINTVYNGTITDEDNTVAVTKEELRNLATKSWSDNFWSIAAGGANVEGYEITELPYLSVTKDSDKSTITLFESGMGIDGNAYSITNWNQLQNINYNTTTLASYFELSNNLDATTEGYTSQVKDGDILANDGKGWNTIGDAGNTSLLFTGTFDGQNHTIDSLEIDGSQLVGQGLFGAITSTATVKNIGLTNLNIKAGDLTGGLVGSNDGTIINAYTTGNISASAIQAYVGGLVGQNINNASISSSYSLASVSSSDSLAYIGGLVGANFAKISDSYFAGNLSGEDGSTLGGLISYVGTNSDIQNSFYKITSSEADNNQGTGLNSNLISYGQIYKDAGWDIRVDNTLASSTPVIKYDSITEQSYWAIAPKTVNYTLSNEEYTYDGANKTLSDIYTTSNIFGNDFVSQNTATTTTTTDTMIDYLDGDYKFQVNSEDVTSYKNAGTYENIKVVSTNDFLNIATTQNTDGKIVINKKELTISDVSTENKTYDGTADATITNYGSIDTGITGETLDLDTTNVSASFSDKNAGTDKTVTVSGYTLSDTSTASASNYTLTSSSVETIATINKKDLSVNYEATNKTYDATTNVIVTESTNDIVTGDSVIISEIASMDNKNAGIEKTVNVSSIELSGTDAQNYNLTNTNAQATTTVDVAKKDVTVIANSDTVTYNGLEQSVSGFTANGLVNGETIAELDQVLASASGINAGEYTSVLSGNDENYNLTFVDGKLIIDPKQIIVKADDKEKMVGEKNPELTYEVEGLIGDDMLNGDLITEVDMNSMSGEYDILQGDLGNSNYAINYEKGTLTVNNNKVQKEADNIVKVSTKIQIPKLQNIVPPQAPQTAQIGGAKVVATSNDGQVLKKVEGIDVKNSIVAIADDSIVTLFNGGVNLPVGVDQEFYTLEDNK